MHIDRLLQTQRTASAPIAHSKPGLSWLSCLYTVPWNKLRRGASRPGLQPPANGHKELSICLSLALFFLSFFPSLSFPLFLFSSLSFLFLLSFLLSASTGFLLFSLQRPCRTAALLCASPKHLLCSSPSALINFKLCLRRLVRAERGLCLPLPQSLISLSPAALPVTVLVFSASQPHFSIYHNTPPKRTRRKQQKWTQNRLFRLGQTICTMSR